jgi:hypothetical protein
VAATIRFALFESFDSIFVLQAECNVIEPFHQTPTGVIVNLKRCIYRSTPYLTGDQVDGNLYPRVCLNFGPQGLHHGLLTHGRDNPCLPEFERKISPNRDEITAPKP